MDYYNGIMEKCGETGQVDAETFKSIFRLAFPERPEAKLDVLIGKLRNVEKTSGTIRKFVRIILVNFLNFIFKFIQGVP